MKSALLLLTILASTPAHALERYCVVTKVYDTGFLEESLSVDEYPDVSITDGEVTLGASLFSVTQGDMIRLTPSVGFEKNIEITQKGGETKYFININNLPTDKTGTLSGQSKGEASPKIADLDCK